MRYTTTAYLTTPRDHHGNGPCVHPHCDNMGSQVFFALTQHEGFYMIACPTHQESWAARCETIIAVNRAWDEGTLPRPASK